MKFTDTSRGVSIAKDPAIVKLKGTYYMYYSVSPGNRDVPGWDIGIAVSRNMEKWQKIGELERIGEAEKNGICAPAAILTEDVIHLFYQTYGNGRLDAICHATSTDGIHFEHDSTNPVFHPDGEWNNGRAIDADVILFGDYLYMYFATRNPEGRIQMLGAAKALKDSGYGKTDWHQCCTQSILKPELDWEQECIEAPAAIVSERKVFMFYAGAYNNCPQQIGLAASDDGVIFKRVSDTPFLSCGKPGEWNSSESGHPYIFEDDDGKIYLFYQGNNDNGRSWYISKQEVRFRSGGFILI